VVDDDSDTLGMIATFLRFEGFDVTTAGNGAEGLAAASGSFDAVTTDLEMPCMDGGEFIQRIRTLPVKPVPIIVMTAQTLDPAMTGRLSSCHVVTKPFNLEDLARLLRSLLTTCSHDQFSCSTCPMKRTRGSEHAAPNPLPLPTGPCPATVKTCDASWPPCST
jgi:two-component system OmpR family response regulator